MPKGRFSGNIPISLKSKELFPAASVNDFSDAIVRNSGFGVKFEIIFNGKKGLLPFGKNNLRIPSTVKYNKNSIIDNIIHTKPPTWPILQPMC